MGNKVKGVNQHVNNEFENNYSLQRFKLPISEQDADA